MGNSPQCDNATLHTTTGPAALNARWTANTIILNWDAGNDATFTAPVQGNAAYSCEYDGGITLPTAPTRSGYTFGGWAVRNIFRYLDTSIDGEHRYARGWYNNQDLCHIDNADDNSYCSQSVMSDVALNEWKTEFSYGTVYGRASCQPTVDAGIAYLAENVSRVIAGQKDPALAISEYTQIAGAEKGAILQQAFTEYTNGHEDDATYLLYKNLYVDSGNEFTTTSSGQYCFCQANGYKANGATSIQHVSSPSWVFDNDNGNADGCALNCARRCAENVSFGSAFRRAIFDVAGE